jgi:hypothetical protein
MPPIRANLATAFKILPVEQLHRISIGHCTCIKEGREMADVVMHVFVLVINYLVGTMSLYIDKRTKLFLLLYSMFYVCDSSGICGFVIQWCT